MHQVDAQLLCHRIHDGDKDVHGGVGVHEAAGDQEDHVDDQQENDLVACDVQQQALGSLRNAMDGADVSKQSGRTDDQHNAAGGLAGVNQQFAHVLPLDLAIDEHTHEQAVNHGHGSGLRRGEDAAVDAAQDDDRHQEAPESRTEGSGTLAPGGALTGSGQALLTDLQHNDDDQSQAHHDAGEDAAHEHITNGDAGDGGVHNESDGGRDNDGDGGSRCHHGGGKGSGEAAAVDHGGDQNDAQSSHGSRAGTGNRAEEASHDNADDCNTAAAMAHAVINEVDQTGRNAGLGHDVAGQHEERNGQQQELGHAVIDVGRNNSERVVCIKHCQNGRGTQADCNRNVQQQHDEEGAEQNQVNHCSLPPLLRS